MSEVFGSYEAVLGRPYDHEFDPAVVQWKRHASNTKHTYNTGTATQKVDDLNIDFALLGNPSSQDLVHTTYTGIHSNAILKSYLS